MGAMAMIARASILGTVLTMAPLFLVFPELLPLELVPFDVPLAADVEL